MAVPKKNQWGKVSFRSMDKYHNVEGDASGRTTRESWGGGTDSADYHRYTGKTGYFGEPTIDATVGMIHSGAHGSTQYPPEELLTPGSSDTGNTWPPSKMEDWLPAASEKTNVGQISLFKHRSQPAHSTVNGLFSTKSGRTGAMTGLGMAAADSVNEYGRMAEPSSNLSKHSSRIVQRLQGTGAVSGEQSYNANNGLGFWDEPMERTPSYLEEPVSPEKVAQGSRIMRSVARRPRTQKTEQGTLF